MASDEDGSGATVGNGVRDKGRAEWPWYGQLCVMALLLLAIVLVFSVSSLLPPMTGSQDAPLITGYVAMTAVLISGTFLFMTFRMDRNARHEARTIVEEEIDRIKREATTAAKDAAGRTAQEAVQQQLVDIVRSVLFSHLNVLRESIDRAVAAMMADYVRDEVRKYLDASLGERVSEALSDEQGRRIVLDAVRQTVTDQIGWAVQQHLDASVRRELPEAVKEELRPVVSERLKEETLQEIVKSSDDVRENVAIALPTVVDALLGKHVEGGLPGVVEAYFQDRPRWWRRGR